MKYKRRRSKVSKYVSYTDDKSRNKAYKKVPLKKRSSWAAGLILVCFALTRLNIADADFVKKVFTHNGSFAIKNAEFLNTAGDYIAEFCFGYLKGKTNEPARAHAESKQKESKPQNGQTPALSEAEPVSAGIPLAKEKNEFAPSLPCAGEVTSEFGERVHPITAEVTFHNGIDVALNEGDEIKACFDGEVIKSEYNEFSGNYIVIQHQDDYTSSYAHMSKLLAPVGAQVKKGDTIGLAGSTGSATGPHLHFEIRQGGTPLDPWRMIETNNE